MSRRGASLMPTTVPPLPFAKLRLAGEGKVGRLTRRPARGAHKEHYSSTYLLLQPAAVL